MKETPARRLIRVGMALALGLSLAQLGPADVVLALSVAQAGQEAPIADPVAALAAYDRDVERSGTEDLARLEEISHAFLEQGLLTGDETTYFFIGRALHSLGDDRGLELLHRIVLEATDAQLQIGLIAMLADLGDPRSVSVLGTVLTEESANRVTVAYQLRKFASPEGVPALLQGLKDEDYRVRVNSAWSLGLIGDSSALPGLIEALRDEDYDVRYYAAEAVGRLGDPAGVSALQRLLGSERQPFVRLNALVALRRLGSDVGLFELEAAFPAALEWETLGDYGNRAWPSLEGERQAYRELFDSGLSGMGLARDQLTAAALLLLWGPEELYPLLGELLEYAAQSEDSDVRNACIDVIKLTEDRAFLPILHRLLNSPSDFDRWGAAAALNEVLPDTSSVPSLVAAVSNRSYNARRHAAEALGKIGDARGVETLIQALADPSSTVWPSAFSSVIMIGDAALPQLLRALESTEEVPLRRFADEKLIDEVGVPDRARVDTNYSGLKYVVERSVEHRRLYGAFRDSGFGELHSEDSQRQGFLVDLEDKTYVWAYSNAPATSYRGLVMLAMAEIYGGEGDSRQTAAGDPALEFQGPEGEATSVLDLARQLEGAPPTARSEENDILAMALSSKDHALQFTARDLILAKHDPTLVPVLKAQRDQRGEGDDILSRINFNAVLAELGDLESLQALREAGQSTTDAERVLAQTSLVGLGDLSVLPSLRAQLAEEDAHRRYPAAWAILRVVRNARERSQVR